MSNGHTIPQLRFLVDENLPRSLVADLQRLGYAAEHVYDIQMGGANDSRVFAYAQSQHAILLTGDKDFSNMLAYAPPHAGIIVVEIPDSLPPDTRKQAILRQLTTISDQSLDDALVIIELGPVRVRR